MKKVLLFDREYPINFMKSDKFETICVSLNLERKKRWEKEGVTVVACFEEEYSTLEESIIPDNYLIHSFDSDRFLTRFPYNKRREILGKEITFWRNILDKYKPDIIVNEIITMEFIEVLYIEALKRNIPYKTWLLHPLPNRFVWSELPYNSLISQEKIDTIVYDETDLEYSDNYIMGIREKHFKPYYINFKQPSAFKLFLKSFRFYLSQLRWYLINIIKKKVGKFVYEDYYRIAIQELKRGISLLFYNYDTFVLEEGIDYVYYPVHFEPEAAVDYMGDCYGDQDMLIQRIAHSLGANQKLIVKEHPQQRGFLLTRKYRQLKKKYCNIIYLDGKISSYDVIKKMSCMVTLNGTAGFEALICGKPVIYFGDVYYKHCPGNTSCDSFRNLKLLLRNKSYNIPNVEEIKIFIAKLHSITIDAFPEMVDGRFEDSDLKKITVFVEQSL